MNHNACKFEIPPLELETFIFAGLLFDCCGWHLDMKAAQSLNPVICAKAVHGLSNFEQA